jgi:hypothetical protein
LRNRCKLLVGADVGEEGDLVVVVVGEEGELVVVVVGVFELIKTHSH